MKLIITVFATLAMLAFPGTASTGETDFVDRYVRLTGETPMPEVALALEAANANAMRGPGNHVGDIRTTCVVPLGELCSVTDVTGTATIQDEYCTHTEVLPNYRQWDGAPGIVEVGEGDHYAATMDDAAEHTRGRLVGVNCIHDLLGLVLYVNSNGMAEFE